MELSLKIIQDFLPIEYKTELVGECVQKLTRPRIYRGDGMLEPGKMYVIREDMLPPTYELDGCVLVCVGKGMRREWRGSKCSILFVSGTTDHLLVYESICTIFDLFDNWENEMRDELEKEFDFDYRRIASIGAKMLGNTVGMSNQFLQVLFTTEIHNESGKVSIVEGKYDQPLLHTGDELNFLCQQEKQLHVPYFSAFSSPGMSVYCSNIFIIDHFAGCCFLYPDRRPMHESDTEIADVFFHYFALGFIKYIRSYPLKDDPSTATMNALLTGSPLSRKQRKLLSLAENESWVLFRLEKRNNTAAMPTDYMHAAICSLLPHTAYAGVNHNAITGILRVQDDLSILANSSITSFQKILTHMGYIAGLSNEFKDLERIGEYRFQADYALSHSQKAGQREKDFYFFNDCVLDYMVSACCTNLSPDSLLSRQFKDLQHYDETHSSNLLQTLDCFLRNEMNVSETARELFLHRSSLVKRLDKIKQLLECDLSSPNLRLYYRICFELIHRNDL